MTDNNRGNHRPKLKGSCQLIESIEDRVKRLPGSMIIRDSGKRGDYNKWNSDSSPFFLREYLVPVGWSGLRTVVVGIKFHYDYREGLGRMEATNGGKFQELVDKDKGLKEEITRLLVGEEAVRCPHCGGLVPDPRGCALTPQTPAPEAEIGGCDLKNPSW